MNAFSAAFTWAVNAFALAWIPCPSAWLADRLLNDRTRDFRNLCFPVATLNLDGTGVINRLCYIANDFSSLGFLDRNHNRVVDNLFVSFTNWLHNGVVDYTLASLVDRLANGVIDDLAVGLVHRLHDCVVDDLAVGLVHRLHDRVVDDLAMGLVHRLHAGVIYNLAVCLVDRATYGVRALSRMRFVYGLHNRILSSLGLVYRLAHDTVDRTVTCLLARAADIDYLVFHHRLVFGACTLLSSFFINCAAYCFHDSVGRWAAATIGNTANILVADRSAISGISLTGKCCRKGEHNRHQ